MNESIMSVSTARHVNVEEPTVASMIALLAARRFCIRRTHRRSRMPHSYQHFEMEITSEEIQSSQRNC